MDGRWIASCWFCCWFVFGDLSDDTKWNNQPAGFIEETSLDRLSSSMGNQPEQQKFNRYKRGMKTFQQLADGLHQDTYKKPTDPMFKFQWYLKNDGDFGRKGLDLNVEEAWRLGYTGKNITVAILDDGIDYTHPDLISTYFHEASYDYSSNDPFPYPRYTDDGFNSHGTRCAGEIAAMRDNSVCGVGVAYNANIAGIRMLDQPLMTDSIEARALSHRFDLIDIYSASWGPIDDGAALDGPRQKTQLAILNGISRGRGGKGNIYVWASGDGGSNDDCNCDGYTNSMWTISINSAVSDGETAVYDESCSSTLASTFSNGKAGDHRNANNNNKKNEKNKKNKKNKNKKRTSVGVATTDLYGQCTLHHSGTSASAPQAAGVFALVLQANPDLTWRDMQHLTVLTAKRNQLYDPNGVHLWQLNAAGLEFNHLFGFGVLNAGDMVRQAELWKRMPSRHSCQAGLIRTMLRLHPRHHIVMDINSTVCEGTTNHVRYLEHVQCIITTRHGIRGKLKIYVTSPLGTRSLILQERRKDRSQRGFRQWPFMTTHMWAERAEGSWKLEIIYNGDYPDQPMDVYEWILVLHGTTQPPYTNQMPFKKSTKLNVVKMIHQNNFVDVKNIASRILRFDNQKRLGDNPDSKL